MSASLSPPYEPVLRPIATWAVPAAFSSSITCPRGTMLGLKPIPSSAITSAPRPASATSSRSICAARPRREEEQKRGLASGLQHGRRGVCQRALARPELESRLGARVLHGGKQLRAFFGERLVHEDQHPLAGLDPRGADEIAAPAGM